MIDSTFLWNGFAIDVICIGYVVLNLKNIKASIPFVVSDVWASLSIYLHPFLPPSSESESKSESESQSDSDSESKDNQAVGVLGSLTPEELEKLKEAVDERKKLIATLRGKPWPMRKKLVILRYVTAVFMCVYTRLQNARNLCSVSGSHRSLWRNMKGL